MSVTTGDGPLSWSRSFPSFTPCSESPLEEYARSLFVEVLLAYPHSVEGFEARHGGSTDPARVLPVSWRHQGDGDVSARQLLYALVEPLVEAGQEGSSSGDDYGIVESLAHIDIALFDRVDDHFVDAGPFEAYLLGAEQDLGCPELL